METGQVTKAGTFDIEGVFQDIIEGKFVKRSKHSLVFEGEKVTQIFIKQLQQNGYIPITVKDAPVSAGEKIPAFYLVEDTAYFGWIFWEQFTGWKLRKLFGTVVKNQKGDWLIQIPESKPTIVYANQSLKVEMDIDFPPEF